MSKSKGMDHHKEGLAASYHHVVVDELPGALSKLKDVEIPPSCTLDPGVVDKRFRGMAPGRLVPLLIVWLQQLESRVVHLEREREERPLAPSAPPRAPPGWFANWAPF